MSWRCKFGLHDWETVDYVSSREQLKLNMEAEAKARKTGQPAWPPCQVISDGARRLFDRVCLRCKKHDFQIAKERRLIHLEEERNKARNTQSKDILKELHNQ